MFIYILIPAVTVMASVLLTFSPPVYIKNKNLNIMVFLFISFIIPFIIMGYRTSDIGIDTHTYVEVYNIYKRKSFASACNYSGEEFEIGYMLLTFILAHTTSNYHTFLIVTGILLCFLYARAIYYLSRYPMMSTLSFFFVSYFLYYLNALRQGIAVGIVMNGLISLSKGKYIKYITWVLLASLFHSFALVFLVLLIPTVFVNSIKGIKAATIFIIIVILTTLPLVHVLVLKYFPHYDYYFRHNFNADSRFGITSTAIVIIDIVLIKMLILKYKKKDTNKIITKFLIFSLAAGAASLIMMPTFGIYERASKYFNAFIMIAVTEAITVIKNKNWKYAFLCLFFSFSFTYYLYLLIINAYKLIPFTFYC